VIVYYKRGAKININSLHCINYQTAYQKKYSQCHMLDNYLYRVGQIKQGQLTFLLVTSKRIYNFIKLHRATSDMMSTLS